MSITGYRVGPEQLVRGKVYWGCGFWPVGCGLWAVGCGGRGGCAAVEVKLKTRQTRL